MFLNSIQRQFYNHPHLIFVTGTSTLSWEKLQECWGQVRDGCKLAFLSEHSYGIKFTYTPAERGLMGFVFLQTETWEDRRVDQMFEQDIAEASLSSPAPITYLHVYVRLVLIWQ